MALGRLLRGQAAREAWSAIKHGDYWRLYGLLLAWVTTTRPAAEQTLYCSGEPAGVAADQ